MKSTLKQRLCGSLVAALLCAPFALAQDDASGSRRQRPSSVLEIISVEHARAADLESTLDPLFQHMAVISSDADDLQHGAWALPPAPTVMDAQPPIIPVAGLQANAEPTRVELAPGFLGQPLETTSPNVTIIRVFERYTGESKAGSPVGRLPDVSPAHRTT